MEKDFAQTDPALIQVIAFDALHLEVLARLASEGMTVAVKVS